jgi:hypothetical protein
MSQNSPGTERELTAGRLTARANPILICHSRLLIMLHTRACHSSDP